MENKNRITVGYAFLFLAYAGYYRENVIMCLLGLLFAIGILAINYKARKPKINTYILLALDFILLGFDIINLLGFILLLSNIICIYLILPSLQDKDCRMVISSLVIALIGLSLMVYIVNNVEGYDNSYYLRSCGMLLMLWVPLLLGIIDYKVMNEITIRSRVLEKKA